MSFNSFILAFELRFLALFVGYAMGLEVALLKTRTRTATSLDKVGPFGKLLFWNLDDTAFLVIFGYFNTKSR